MAEEEGIGRYKDKEYTTNDFMIKDNSKKNINMATVMKQCNCESKFQDELYGKGVRVYNLREGKANGKATCTVCGREQ